MAERIQYRCRDCAEEFKNGATANAHNDATGHFQTFRCWSCPRPLSAHTETEYAACLVIRQRALNEASLASRTY